MLYLWTLEELSQDLTRHFRTLVHYECSTPLNLMSLSNKTIQGLSKVLTKDVIDYIQQDERYIELMMELIPEAVSEALGSEDIDLVTDIAMCVSDNILMRPYQDS